MIDHKITELINYALTTGLIPAEERIYSTNLLLDLFKKTEYDERLTVPCTRPLNEILSDLCNEAVQRSLIADTLTERDLFDTKIMNCVMPRPAELITQFQERYKISAKSATDYYYQFSQNTNYIRRDRIVRDKKWIYHSCYGDIEITINLSKPEKDPKAIAAARTASSLSYPKCMLCMENVGYAGRLDYPARQNHRIIPVTINGTKWGFQYSPYVYYNEHCIVFNEKHVPMEICQSTFEKLFDFIEQFPHYFVGSNADLPIVGGSILSHDHFQGGNHTFAMAKAKNIYTFHVPNYEKVDCSIIQWPMSVIRLQSKQRTSIVSLANYILNTWRDYTDESAFIYANTNGEPHNTITPIARFIDGIYELDLTLRNNITTPEHPLGVYHPHEQLHHIKKENIGLIEVMGLAVLPSRLSQELTLLADYIVNKKDIASCPSLAKHEQWVMEFLPHYPKIDSSNIYDILKNEIGKVFVQVLEDAGVYKTSPEGFEAFKRFINTL